MISSFLVDNEFLVEDWKLIIVLLGRIKFLLIPAGVITVEILEARRVQSSVTPDLKVFICCNPKKLHYPRGCYWDFVIYGES